jgi:hypothetical protein
MSAERAVWDLVKMLVGIGRTAADQAAGLVSLVGLAGEPRSGPSCALPGHYGVLKSARNVVFLRTGKGTIVLGYITTPPEGAQAGDAGIVTEDGCHLRLRAKVLTVLDSAGIAVATVDTEAGTVTLAGGTKLVVLDGDNVPIAVALAAHTHPVAGGVAGTSLDIGTSAGTCSSSAAKTKAG